MTSPLHERVSDLAIIAGIAVTPADVEAIEQLLIEERRVAAAPRESQRRGGEAEKDGGQERTGHDIARHDEVATNG